MVCSNFHSTRVCKLCLFLFAQFIVPYLFLIPTLPRITRTFKIFQSIEYAGCKKKIRLHRPSDGNGFPSIQLPRNRFQIFLAFPAHNQSDIRQRVVIDEPIQLGTLLHGVRDCVLDGGRIDGKHKAIFILDIHAGGVDIELAGYQ